MREACGDIVIRDFLESDIEDEVRWQTEETSWMELDTPWEEFEEQDPSVVRDDMRTFFMMSCHMPESVLRPRLEIEAEGRHVGFVSSYYLDPNYDETDYDPFQSTEGRKTCLGIAICEEGARGKGIGTKALSAYIAYLKRKGVKEVCIETHPEDIPMVRIAEKLGFRIVKTRKYFHERDGRRWDSVVYAMKI